MLITFDQTVKTIAVATQHTSMMGETVSTDVPGHTILRPTYLKEEQLGGISVPIKKPFLLNFFSLEMFQL